MWRKFPSGEFVPPFMARGSVRYFVLLALIDCSARNSLNRCVTYSLEPARR